jgi:hypothetical protein
MMLKLVSALRASKEIEGLLPAVELLAGTVLVGMALLWFRRSRRQQPVTEAKPAVTEPAQSPQPRSQHDTRAPLSIRGLLLLNLKPSDGTEQIEAAPPLGPRDDVIRTVQATVPGLAVDSAGRGEVAADDYRVAVDLGPHDPVHAMIASADGDAGIEMLRTLVQSQGWRAYAAKAGVFIEPEALDLFALPDALPSRSQP